MMRAGENTMFMPFARVLCALLVLPLAIFAQTGEVETDRPNAKKLAPPAAEPSWQFAVFGDRTGGPESGLSILEDAVGDVNLVHPDLVMTVGDLINGYNPGDAWMRQMRDYRAVMDRLRMPWYPVAGNHDIYFRGKNRPKGGHERNYEKHFGPLWYWFKHKDAAFIVLFSDEGDPKDDSKGFRKERHVQFSERQIGWLRTTLQKTKELQHAFVFLHHPRWRGKYYENTNWPRVEKMLGCAGNVRGVFAGHMHEMRYDRGAKGLEFFTLGATGSSLRMDFPAAGFMHHYNLVTVRPEGIELVALPVGAAIDHRSLTPERLKDLYALLERGKPECTDPLDLDGFCVGAPGQGQGQDRGLSDKVVLGYENPAAKPIEIELELAPEASGWTLIPSRPRLQLEAGQKGSVSFRLALDPRLAAGGFAAPRMIEHLSYEPGSEALPLPKKSRTLPSRLSAGLAPKADGRNRCLALDGGGCVGISSKEAEIPDGPFTIEGRLLARSFRGRRPFLAKSENSEYCLFVNKGIPEFSVHLDGRYLSAKTKKPLLQTERWYHIAGVYDGGELRLYVDGRLVARQSAKGAGKRTRNRHPLFIGADPNRKGLPVDRLQGRIDDVRLSRGARYAGERVRVPRDLESDDRTVLLLDFDMQAGALIFDTSPQELRPELRGSARIALRDSR
jgi:Concanavalin A-like lectin/glucanases superfamily/Calcineurin-like phosphoesterase